MYEIQAWYEPLGRVPAVVPLSILIQGCTIWGAILILSQFNTVVSTQFTEDSFNTSVSLSVLYNFVILSFLDI